MYSYNSIKNNSEKYINIAPTARPMQAGKKASPFKTELCSMAGIISDQTQAEAIIPPAKPSIIPLFLYSGIKNTKHAPKVFNKNGRVKHNKAKTQFCIFLK